MADGTGRWGSEPLSPGFSASIRDFGNACFIFKRMEIALEAGTKLMNKLLTFLPLPNKYPLIRGTGHLDEATIVCQGLEYFCSWRRRIKPLLQPRIPGDFSSWAVPFVSKWQSWTPSPKESERKKKRIKTRASERQWSGLQGHYQ